jgi:hypothetical protein
MAHEGEDAAPAADGTRQCTAARRISVRRVGAIQPAAGGGVALCERLEGLCELAQDGEAVVAAGRPRHDRGLSGQPG